jgi:hypothetical protein
MRIVAGCLLLVAAALGPQQSSSEYHGIYGPSDLERFTVRPGITMTVEYGPDQVGMPDDHNALETVAGDDTLASNVNNAV